MLTQRQIQTQLQIANCCGAKKVNTYIENLKVNKYCPEILKEANILFGFIDAIKCYKIFSETEVLETYTFTIAGDDIITLQTWIDMPDVQEPRTFILSIINCDGATLGGYPPELPRTISSYLDFVQDNINNAPIDVINWGFLMDWNFNGSEYVITMTQKSCDSTCLSAKWGFDIINVELNERLSYLRPMNQNYVCEYPYKDCITEEQVLNILAAIKRICNGACTDYVNFQLN